MNIGKLFRSIIAGAVLVILPVLTGCGRSEDQASAPAGSAVSATPAEKDGRLSNYREKGIKPRKAKFYRKWE